MLLASVLLPLAFTNTEPYSAAAGGAAGAGAGATGRSKTIVTEFVRRGSFVTSFSRELSQDTNVASKSWRFHE